MVFPDSTFPVTRNDDCARSGIFLRKHISGQLKIEGATSQEAFNEYLRCYQNPEMIHAICEDYRAAATIDLDDDAADTSARIRCPLQLLWGGLGTVGQLYNVVGTWKEKALNVQGSIALRTLPAGRVS